MSTGNLLTKIDAFRLAEQGVSLQGVLQIKAMPRLGVSLASTDGEVTVAASFGVDEEGIHFLRCRFTTEVMLQCQRCMTSFSYKIDNTLTAGILAAESEISDLPNHYEPVIAKDGILQLQETIEDELILSLPIVPMHKQKECPVKLPLVVAESNEMQTEKVNPFQVIEVLKRKH